MKGLGGLAALLRLGPSRGAERGETTASGAKVRVQAAGEMPGKHDRAPLEDEHPHRDGSVEANIARVADGVLGPMTFEEFPEDRSFAALLASSVSHGEIVNGDIVHKAEVDQAMSTSPAGDSEARASLPKQDDHVVPLAAKPTPVRSGEPPIVAAMHPPERRSVWSGGSPPIPVAVAAASPACVTPPDVVFETRPPARSGATVLANRASAVPLERKTSVAAPVAAPVAAKTEGATNAVAAPVAAPTHTAANVVAGPDAAKTPAATNAVAGPDAAKTPAATNAVMAPVAKTPAATNAVMAPVAKTPAATNAVAGPVAAKTPAATNAVAAPDGAKTPAATNAVAAPDAAKTPAATNAVAGPVAGKRPAAANAVAAPAVAIARGATNAATNVPQKMATPSAPETVTATPTPRNRQDHGQAISAPAMVPKHAGIARGEGTRPRDLIRSAMNGMRQGTTIPSGANPDVKVSKKPNAVSSRRGSTVFTPSDRDRVRSPDGPSLPDAQRRVGENVAVVSLPLPMPLQKGFDTGARRDKGIVPNSATARRSDATAVASKVAPEAEPSIAPTLASMVASIVAPSLAPMVAPTAVPPTAPRVTHGPARAWSDGTRPHVGAARVEPERAARRASIQVQAKPEVPSVGHAVAFAALFPGVPIARVDNGMKAVPPPVPGAASDSSHVAPARSAPASVPAPAPAVDSERPRPPTAGASPVEARPTASNASATAPTVPTNPVAPDQPVLAPNLPVGMSLPAPAPREAAPLLDHATQDPTLHVATLGGHAHMKLDAGDAGELSLHLRVQDGVADVRVDGTAAQTLDIRSSQVRTALAGEGISLGRFETSALSNAPSSASAPSASAPAPAGPDAAPRPQPLPDAATMTASGSGFGSQPGDGRPQWNLDDRQPDARPLPAPLAAASATAESPPTAPDGHDGVHVTA